MHSSRHVEFASTFTSPSYRVVVSRGGGWYVDGDYHILARAALSTLLHTLWRRGPYQLPLASTCTHITVTTPSHHQSHRIVRVHDMCPADWLDSLIGCCNHKGIILHSFSRVYRIVSDIDKEYVCTNVGVFLKAAAFGWKTSRRPNMRIPRELHFIKSCICGARTDKINIFAG
eukprot:c13764_g1_i1 orf=364-882(+)